MSTSTRIEVILKDLLTYERLYPSTFKLSDLELFSRNLFRELLGSPRTESFVRPKRDKEHNLSINMRQTHHHIEEP